MIKVYHEVLNGSGERLVATLVDVATGQATIFPWFSRSYLNNSLAEATKVITQEIIEQQLKLSGSTLNVTKEVNLKKPRSKDWSEELQQYSKEYAIRLKDIYKELPEIDESIEELEESCRKIFAKQQLDGINFDVDKAKRMLEHVNKKDTSSGKYQKLKGYLESWLGFEQDGIIRHECISSSAVTGRCAHKNPNIGQVPSAKTPEGRHCRSLFGPRPDHYQVGADLDSIELRILSHYLERFDGGNLKKIIESKDVHTYISEIIGCTRDEAKLFIYAWLYGAAAGSISDIVGIDLQKSKDMCKRFDKDLLGLKELKAAIIKASSRGHVVTFDGRKIPVDKEYKAINRLLQSGAALVAKRWMVIVNEKIEELGGHQMLFNHDELQFSIPNDICKDKVKEILESGAIEAGNYYKIKTKITCEVKTGSSWLDTH